MAGAVASAQTRRWMGLVTGSWVEASAGSGYTFGFYSWALKAVLQYSQTQLNNLGFAKDVGDNVGLLTGWASGNCSTWVLLCLVHCTALWAMASCGWLRPSVLPLFPFGRWRKGLHINQLPITCVCVPCCYECADVLVPSDVHRDMCGSQQLDMAGHGSVGHLLEELSLMQRNSNWSAERQLWSQQCRAYSAFFTALFSENAASFLLLVSVGPAVVCFLALPFLHITMPHGSLNFVLSGEENRVEHNYIIMIQEQDSPPCQVGNPVNARVTETKLNEAQEEAECVVAESTSNPSNEQSMCPLLSMSAIERSDPLLEVFVERPQLGQDFSLMQAMGYSSAGVFISLVSVWNCLGRLAGGALSEHFVRTKGTRRLVWLAGVQALMLAGRMACSRF